MQLTKAPRTVLPTLPGHSRQNEALTTMTTLTKACTRCKVTKALHEYYVRSGCEFPTESGHYVSECKDCLRQRSKTALPLNPYEPRTLTERLAIERLLDAGIAALPGKAIAAANVDVVCWGCVWVEIKYARYERDHHTHKFTFETTPKQQQRGFLADVVMLICDYGDRMTYHLFEAAHPVFYIKGRVKSGFTFTPGAMEAKKHGNNRVVMTQPLMDEAEDDWGLIERYRVADPRRHLETVKW